MKDNKTGMIVYFDATASGYQILGLSSNCYSTMKASNVIKSYDDDGVIVKRRDLYLDVTDEMFYYVDPLTTILDIDPKKRRKQVKKPVKLLV